MIDNKKIAVVLPAYNAGKTLHNTYNEIPFDIVDEVILVDDNSSDNTFVIAKEIGIKHIIKHNRNLGYGGNQKTCYNKTLETGADIIIMLHPDYQYTPNTPNPYFRLLVKFIDEASSKYLVGHVISAISYFLLKI